MRLRDRITRKEIAERTRRVWNCLLAPRACYRDWVYRRTLNKRSLRARRRQALGDQVNQLAWHRHLDLVLVVSLLVALVLVLSVSYGLAWLDKRYSWFRPPVIQSQAD